MVVTDVGVVLVLVGVVLLICWTSYSAESSSLLQPVSEDLTKRSVTNDLEQKNAGEQQS